MESCLPSETLDLNLLKVLHTLIRTGSVTRTAHCLGVSQPSVSRSLGRLRQVFQDPLLIKTNGGMSLTKRAEALEAPLAQWLTTTAALLQAPLTEDPVNFSSIFRIATTDYGVLMVVLPAMQTILERAPKVRIEVVPLSADNLNALTAGSVDIVITGYDPKPGRAIEQFLYTERYRCLLRIGHPLLAGRSADAGDLTMDEFIEWPHIVATVNDNDGDPVCSQLAKLGRTRRIALRIPYFTAAPHVLLACDAIMVVPQGVADHFVSTCDLQALAAPIDLEPFNYWLLWHERTRRDPATCWLIQQMSAASRT